MKTARAAKSTNEGNWSLAASRSPGGTLRGEETRRCLLITAFFLASFLATSGCAEIIVHRASVRTTEIAETAQVGAARTDVIPRIGQPSGSETIDGRPALLKALSHAQPIQRVGEPEDIANMVLFLAGDESQWVTGKR
jgi:NAD(P)-dependent dehydrogenase (short-subunit alcohol dehydrogenase family)